MTKLNILLIFAIISFVCCQNKYDNLFSSAFISNGDKEIHFVKQKDGIEYDFTYKLDNGEIFNGATNHVVYNIYLLFGANNTIYWFEVDNEEIHSKEITKFAHVAQQIENTIFMKNDYIIFELRHLEAVFTLIPYRTNWDLQNICFSPTNTENHRFNYTISSLNNSRKYNGTTYFESDDALVQRIHIEDGIQCVMCVYEIHFTQTELDSNETFCRGITHKVSEFGSIGSGVVTNINPNLLKSLAG